MLQLFLQPSKITPIEWTQVYQQIWQVVEQFPTKMYRSAPPSEPDKKLETLQFDLVLEENTPTEHIVFEGNWMSYTLGLKVCFYKYWEQQIELAIIDGEEMDPARPITWFPDTPYSNDGMPLSTNGIRIFSTSSIMRDTEGNHYRFVIMAIGIVLENRFPEGALLTASWHDYTEDVQAVRVWLEEQLGQSFDLPLSFDNKRLLASLRKGYDTDQSVVNRIAHLYREKHKQNIQIALEHIGYQPTLEVYTRILSETTFGTFGFADVLDPWIAATKDLEATLELITAAKKYLLRDSDQTWVKKEIAKYDLTYILEKLLHNYILWTPSQRELLTHFHTNQQALEDGDEDLLDTMSRMMGYRIDICPIYASQQELFEAFMYHDPKNGATYKQIIEDWISENTTKYESLKPQIEQAIAKMAALSKASTAQADITTDISNQQFLATFSSSEQYFVKAALQANPQFLQTEKAIQTFKKRVVKGITKYKNQDYLQEMKTMPKAEHIGYIQTRVKKIGYPVHPEFEDWLHALEGETLWLHLHFAVALKLYDAKSDYARFSFLLDHRHWEDWSSFS